MSHFNRFTDRKIVDDLLLSVGSGGFGLASCSSDHAIDCHEWNELSTGWNPTAPFPRCVWTRTGKMTPLFTEENLEAILEQRRLAQTESAPATEDGRTRRLLSQTETWVAAATARRMSNTGAVLPLKEAKLQPNTDIFATPREVSGLGGLSLQHRRLLREGPQTMRQREIELPQPPPVAAGEELVLPPIDVPLVSLSLTYEKLNEKMSWWDEEIRRDIQAKADARNRSKLETLAADEEAAGAVGGNIFSIKSLLHSCTFECDCHRYPERLESGPHAELSARLRHRFAQNVALRRVVRGAGPIAQRRVTIPEQAYGPPELIRGSSGAGSGSGGDSEGGDSGPGPKENNNNNNNNSNNSNVIGSSGNSNGFCSNALGQPKVREAKSMPSIPTDCGTPRTVSLTGKRLQVGGPR